MTTGTRILGAGALVVVLVGTGLWVARAHQREPAAAAAQDSATSGRLQRIAGSGRDEAAIVLDARAAEDAGIETRALASSARAGTMQLTGALIADPGRTVQVQAPVAGRLVAAGAGWPALGERVEEGRVVGQVSDARPITLPRPGTVTRVGAQPGEIVQAGQLLLEVTDFTGMLARVVWAAGAPEPAPFRAMVAALGDAAMPVPGGAASVTRAPRERGVLVGPASDVDSVTRAPVYIYRVSSAWRGARPGAPIVATVALPASAVRGTFVPEGAVVQWQGLAWVYVRHGSRQYVRERVDTAHRVEGGWLVTPGGATGIAPGDTVVVRGAELLLSEEFRSRVTVGEDEDKR